MLPEIKLPINATVRFTLARLSVLRSSDRVRLENRVGVIQGYIRNGRKPTVNFPAENDHTVLRLFLVDRSHLELVALPEPADEEVNATPTHQVEFEADAMSTPQIEPKEAAAPTPQAEPESEKAMTQEELDALFG